MTDEELLATLDADDSYTVLNVLAHGEAGETQLVCLPDSTLRCLGSGLPVVVADKLLVRKYIRSELENRGVWEAVAALDDPRLPRVRQIYELPDRLAVVYDYVPGETLRERIKRAGAMGPREVADVLAELCQVLSRLHGIGLVHRDVTPGNVVLASDGVHLIDMGIARKKVSGATRDTMQLGTWGFASPEQYGFGQTDARSDVYSLGRLLGYLLSATEPSDPSFDQRVREATGGASALLKVFETACALAPDDRFQSAEKFSRALRKALPPQPKRGASRGGTEHFSAAGKCAHDRNHAEARRGLARSARDYLVETPRAFAAAAASTHGWRRLVLVMVLLVAVFECLLFVGSGVMLIVSPKEATDPASGILSFLAAAYFVYAVVMEPTLCALGWGPYDGGGRARVLGRREAYLLGLLAVAELALVFLSFFAGAVTR